MEPLWRRVDATAHFVLYKLCCSLPFQHIPPLITVSNTTIRESVSMVRGQEALVLGVPLWYSDDGSLVPKDRRHAMNQDCRHL